MKRGNVNVVFALGVKGMPPPLEHSLVRTVLDWLCMIKAEGGKYTLSWISNRKKGAVEVDNPNRKVILPKGSKLDFEGQVTLTVHSSDSGAHHQVVCKLPFKGQRRKDIFKLLAQHSAAEEGEESNEEEESPNIAGENKDNTSDNEDPSQDFEAPQDMEPHMRLVTSIDDESRWSSTLYSGKHRTNFVELDVRLKDKRDQLRDARPNLRKNSGQNLQEIIACVVEDALFQLRIQTSINLYFEAEDEYHLPTDRRQRFKVYREENKCILLNVDGFWLWLYELGQQSHFFSGLLNLSNNPAEVGDQPAEVSEQPTPDQPQPASEAVATDTAVSMAPTTLATSSPDLLSRNSDFQQLASSIIRDALGSGGDDHRINITEIADLPVDTSREGTVAMVGVPTLSIELVITSDGKRKLLRVDAQDVGLAKRLIDAGWPPMD